MSKNRKKLTRKLTNKLLLNVIPENLIRDKEDHNEILSREFINYANWLDLLYENIVEKKVNLMIVKGYYDAQYTMYLNIVVFITVVIACCNLAIGILNDKIPDSRLTITQIIIGILGIIVATFAKARDKKDDLVHELLTATNKCNEFLSLCEANLSRLVQYLIDNDDEFNLVVIRKNDSSIKDDDIIAEYQSTFDVCEKTFNTFGSKEAKVLMNGPVSLIYLPGWIPFFRFDPIYLKLLLIPNKNDEYLKYFHKHSNIQDLDSDSPLCCNYLCFTSKPQYPIYPETNTVIDIIDKPELESTINLENSINIESTVNEEINQKKLDNLTLNEEINQTKSINIESTVNEEIN